MTEPHFDMSEVRHAARELAKRRREARRDYERYSEQAADAERDFRRELATGFAKAKSSGMSVGQAEIEAQGQAAEARHTRDLAQAMAKSALLRIDELEADRAMLRQLGDWSQRMEEVKP